MSVQFHPPWRSGLARSTANRHIVAVILAGGEGRRLLPLTLQRAKPAVPFAGSYRLIDFTLSNCINSGIRRIVVITEYQAESVVNYLRPLCSLLRNRGIELLSVCSSGDGSWYSTNGTAGAVFKNLRTILESDPDDILVLSSDHVYRMDYSAMLDFHRRAGSEATVACTSVELSLASSFGILSIDGREMVCDFEEKPNVPKALPGEPSKACASMGIYLFKRDSLVEVVVFPGARIGNNVRARRCIIEEGTVVPDNTRVGYDEQGDHDQNMVSSGGVVVVCNKQTVGDDNEDSNSGSREFGQRVFRAV